MAGFQPWNVKYDLTEAIQMVVTSPSDGNFSGFPVPSS